MDSETLPIVIGVGLLIVGLFLVLNITTLIWMRSALGRKSSGSERGEEESKAPSAAHKVKSWIGVIAALVGLMTTIGGAAKSCDSAPSSPSSIAVQPPSTGYPPITPPVVPPKQEPQQYMPQQQQPQQQQWSAQCCTVYGNCQMMQIGAIGQECFCMDQMGNYATGNVCH